MGVFAKRLFAKNNSLIDSPTTIIGKNTHRACSEHIRTAIAHLAKAGIPNAHVEAERLFAISMGFRSWNEWYTSGEECVRYERIPLFREWISRRQLQEPFHYIIGWKEFYGREFKINSSCFIPRPETELLVDVIKETFHQKSPIHILELGTGSGCIGITLAKELKDYLTITITDNSQKALATAWSNAILCDVLDRLYIAKGSWFDFRYLNPHMVCNEKIRYDCIVSNPPYLSQQDMDSLASGLAYEPFQAFYGGEDGLDAYRQIARQSRDYLKPNGRIILEIGAYQHEPIMYLFSDQGFKLEKNYLDLQSIIRVLIFH